MIILGINLKDHDNQIDSTENKNVNKIKSKKIIVFAGSSKYAEWIRNTLSNYNFFKNVSIKCVFGKMKQLNRNKIIDEFKGNGAKILIGTDLIARGIDVDKVDYVLQIDPPTDPSH